MFLSTLALIFSAIFLFRVLPRLIFKKVNNFDTYFHLILIDFIKTNGVSSMLEPKRFIKPFGLDYPWLMHWFISLFPKSTQSLMERFLNPLLDTMFAMITYFVFFKIGVEHFEALLGTLIYLCSPLTFSNIGTGPRITTFTPRLAGEVLVGTVFILEFLFFINGDCIYFIAAAVLASTAFMISKFAVQALVFINFFLSLILMQWEPIAVPILALLICLIYTRGYYLKILKQQVTHLSYYFKEVLAGRWVISERNDFVHLWRLFKGKEYRKVIENLVVNNSYFILLYKAPVVIFALFLMFENTLTLADKFLLAGMSVFLLTSLKWFLFIGEADRYINFVIFFSIVGVLQSVNDLNVLYSLIIYGLVYYSLDFFYFARKEMLQGGDKNDRFIECLNTLKERKRIATIPYHLGGWRVVYHTKHDWYYPIVFLGEDLERSKDFWLKYPYLNFNKCKALLDEYDLDMIFLDENAINREFGLGVDETGLFRRNLGDGVVALSDSEDKLMALSGAFISRFQNEDNNVDPV